MSKVKYDFDNTDYTSDNPIENIIHDLPTYDLDFMDVFIKMRHTLQVSHMAHFLYIVSEKLLNCTVEQDNTRWLSYIEDGYQIRYGIMRCPNKKIMAGILITHNDDYNPTSLYSTDTAFTMAMNIDMEDYNFIKTYILGKCIKDKNMCMHILNRLFGLLK